MIEKEQILKRFSKIEDKLFVSKILDKVRKAVEARCEIHTDFLDPYQRSIADKVLSGMDDIYYGFEGGYMDAERVVLFLRPNFIYTEDDAFTGKCFKLIHISQNGRDNLSHRDYLGSLMGLGIKREKIGDILIDGEECRIVVLAEIADYISYNLNKVGNARVTVVVEEMDVVEAPEKNVKEIRATVASLRLDSVAGAGFGMSRSKVSEFIKAGRLNLNWEMTDSLTKTVKEGDTLSIRGKGRVVLEKVGNLTKKDRINIVLKKFI